MDGKTGCRGMALGRGGHAFLRQGPRCALQPDLATCPVPYRIDQMDIVDLPATILLDKDDPILRMDDGSGPSLLL